MSNRYWQVISANIAGLNEMVQRDTLALLAKTDPLMASRLQAINWTQVADYVIGEAIKEAATASGFKFVTDASQVKGEAKLNGRLIGALVKDERSLAWVRDKTGVHCIKQALGREDDRTRAVRSKSIRMAEEAFNVAYRKQAMKAMAGILSGGKMTTMEQDGQLVIRLEMEV